MKSFPIPVVATAAGRPRPAETPPRWRLQRLLDAPHRLGFFAGALMLAGTALVWLAWLVLRHGFGIVPAWAVSPGLAHSLAFGFGFMPLFFVGFLFTAGPKWLGRPEVSAESLAEPTLASLAGWAVFGIGVHLGAAPASLGLAAVTWGWFGYTRRFLALLRASTVPDRTHARVVAAASVAGVAALALATASLALGREDVARFALQLGLWGFVGIVYVTVAHRMVPFFTASALPMLDAWRPMWLLAVFVALMLAQVPFAAAELWLWPWPAALRVLQVGVESVSAAGLLALAWRWGLVQSLKVRLLGMLHLGFVWLGLGFALAAVSHAGLLASGGSWSLGLAPQHALTMGFFGSILLAMATRVAAGHGGRTLAADGPAWALFLLLQAAVVLRVAAAAWPAAEPALLVAAALAWAGAVGGWSLRHARWFGRPRLDGKPG